MDKFRTARATVWAATAQHPNRGESAPPIGLAHARPVRDKRRAKGGPGMVKVATFNINGIKARHDAFCAWLDEAAPDVVVAQEIKSVDEAFPRDAFEDRGYRVETHGQKSFNGVAILSRLPLEDVSRGLPGDDSDEQARWIEATVIGEKDALRICGLYLPNGNPAPGPKYDYKLAWMARLETYAQTLLASEMPVIMAGDYNVIPQPEDVHDPKAWAKDALFLPQTRAAFRRIVNLGFTDAISAHRPAPAQYTFWDYQRGAWERDNGIRIDHLLMSAQAADMMRDAGIERGIRGREKPSDHVPVWVDLDL